MKKLLGIVTALVLASTFMVGCSTANKCWSKCCKKQPKVHKVYTK